MVRETRNWNPIGTVYLNPERELTVVIKSRSATVDATTTLKNAVDLLLILILGAPSNHAGRNSTGILNRRDAGLAAPRHGWRGGGPKSLADYGHTEPSEVPSGGARALLVTWLGRHSGLFPKVTRCQSGTLSGRYRSNGYVHNPTVLTVRPPSRASPLPQLDCGVSGT